MYLGLICGVVVVMQVSGCQMSDL